VAQQQQQQQQEQRRESVRRSRSSRALPSPSQPPPPPLRDELELSRARMQLQRRLAAENDGEPVTGAPPPPPAAAAPPSPPASPPVGADSALVLDSQLKAELRRRAVQRFGRLAATTARSFVAGRFAAHAQYWQLLTWVAQILLALLSAAGNQLWHHFADPLELQFMWPRVVGATFVICGVWATHTLVEPFEYGLQNVAASWLYLAQLGLLWLGAVRDAGLERFSEFAAPRPPLTADRIPLPSGVRDAQG